MGIILAGHIYIKKAKLKVKLISLADAVVIPATVALILGRFANFINSELLGYAVDVPWCVVFPAIDNLCRHPYQLYAALAHIIVLIIRNIQLGILACRV